MRKWAPRSLALGISRDGIALVLREGWRQPTTHLLYEGSVAQGAAGNVAALATLIDTALAAHCPGGALNIRALISDDLARFFMVTPPSNAANWGDCESASLMRFESLYDTPTTGWTVRSSPQANGAFLACAVPSALVQSVALEGRGKKMKLVSLQPLFTASWNRWARQKTATGWFASSVGTALTLGVVQQQRLVAVLANPFSLHAVENVSQFTVPLSLEATRFGVDRPTRLDLFVPTGRDAKWRAAGRNDERIVSVHCQTGAVKSGAGLHYPSDSAWLADLA